MSDELVTRLAAKLGTTEQEFSSLWSAIREEMFTCLQEGVPVDLGFAYLNQSTAAARVRHDLQAKATVSVPAHPTIRFTMPPHAKRCMVSRSKPHWAIWLSRRQLKELPKEQRLMLDAEGLKYYDLKGVTA